MGKVRRSELEWYYNLDEFHFMTVEVSTVGI